MNSLDVENIKFDSITYGRLSSQEVIEIIKDFLEFDPKSEYSLVVGTDSHERAGSTKTNRNINLVTAILVHRRGHGGRYFWVEKNKTNIHSLREKIYAETLMSLEFAAAFIPELKKNLNGNSPNYNLEIHIDVGEHGDTRDMIKEVVGMVTGNGYVAKTKPEAYGATYVADKHT